MNFENNSFEFSNLNVLSLVYTLSIVGESFPLHHLLFISFKKILTVCKKKKKKIDRVVSIKI